MLRYVYQAAGTGLLVCFSSSAGDVLLLLLLLLLQVV
jgi:hypothetical protein